MKNDVKRLRALIGELVVAVFRKRAEAAAHEVELAKHQARRAEFLERQPGAELPANVRWPIDIAEAAATSCREQLAGFEQSLAEARAALARVLGPPVAVFGIFDFSYIGADGQRTLAKAGQVHSLPAPVADAATAASLGLLASSIAGHRACEEATRGFKIEQTGAPVAIPDVAGFNPAIDFIAAGPASP